MNHRLTTHTLALLVAWLATTAAFGAELSVPAFSGLVVDRANVLSEAQETALTRTLEAFGNATNGQMAVLTIPSLEGDSIEAFSIRVADKWQVGDKERDDGVILIVAVNDRQSRLEVGLGFQGNINDARAGDLLRAMAPYLRNGDYLGGFQAVAGGAAHYITGQQLSGIPPPPAHRPSRNTNLPFIFFVVLVLLFMSFSWRHGGLVVIASGGTWSSGSFGGRGGGFRGGGFSGGGGGGFNGGGASGSW